MLDRLLGFLGYEKAYRAGSVLGQLLPGSMDSPRPNVRNMQDFLGRYADQAWVYICISVLQSKLAGVPLKIYKRQGKEVIEIPDHPLKKLLDKVNPFMDGYDLLESTMGFLGLVGTGYWLLDEFLNGVPTCIYPLDPSKVRVRADKDKFIAGWVYEPSPGVDPVRLDVSEVIQFKTWNPLDPFYGMAPLGPGRDASDLLMKSSRYNNMFFDNSAEPGGILSSDQPIDQTEVAGIREGWAKMHQGQRKAHKIAILHGGLKWQDVTKSHKDMQFVDMTKMSRGDVLGVYRMPPAMVGIYDEVNYNNANVQRRIFWQDTMVPWMKKVQGAINAGLVQPYDPNVFAAFDLSEVPELQEDKLQMAQEDEILTRSGIKKINEVRAQRKLPPVPWGETWNAPLGLMPIEEHKTPEPNEPTPEKPKPKPEDEEEDDKAKSVLRRDAAWRAFKSVGEIQERRWAGAMAGLFNGQEREVKANLQRHWEKKSVQARLDDKGGKTKQALDVILFNGSDAMKLFRRKSKELYVLTMVAETASQADRYSLIKFDITNPRVLRWIDDKSFKFAEEVNKVTEEALRFQLEEAIKAGESISSVSKRIEEVFDAARGYRADRIARTEVVSASNKGAMELYIQNGIQASEWLTARDGSVRESHQIDGETRNIGEKFTNGLEFPGDPSGSAEEVINCRCAIAPKIKG